MIQRIVLGTLTALTLLTAEAGARFDIGTAAAASGSRDAATAPAASNAADRDGSHAHRATDGLIRRAVDAAHDAFVPEARVIAIDAALIGDQLLVPLELDGTNVVLRLEPFTVRGDGFVVRAVGVDGSTALVAPPAPRTWRGTVDGMAGAVCAATWHDGRLHATIRLSDGETWQVQPAGADLRAPGGEGLFTPHLLYRWSEVLPDEHGCGVPVDALNMPLAEAAGPGGVAGDEPCNVTCKVAIAADVEYYLANDSSIETVVADIESVMNAVSLIYGVDVSISYSITAIVVYTDEPDGLEATDPEKLLYEFQAAWIEEPIERDVAHLMTGRNLDGTVIGMAFFSGVCNEENGFGLSQSQYSTNFAKRVALTAHEFGHNWNATHCNFFPDCSIMCSAIGGCSGVLTTFSASSVTQIIAYRNTATCLATGLPFPPLARTDSPLYVPGVPVVVDVLANDVDINCDDIALTGWSETTQEGGVVELCAGCGAGGRDALLYTSSPDTVDGDVFSYSIEAGGEQSIGEVLPQPAAPRPADEPALTAPGLDALYYLYNGIALPDFQLLVPVNSGVLSALDIQPTMGEFADSDLSNSFAAQFFGYLEVPGSDIYTISIESDEGSRLYVGDELLLNNDGVHPMYEVQGTIALAAGKHAITVQYFERAGAAGLLVRIAGGGLEKQIVPPSMWSRAIEGGNPDIDGNGVVNGADLGALLNAWGTSNPAADLNGDGTVDGLDLAILLAAWEI